MNAVGSFLKARVNPVFISNLMGLTVAILGMVVLVGWYFHKVTLIQVHPSFVPMQYNTALGFLLSGCGLLMAVRRQYYWAVLFGTLVALIGGLTLIEYIADFDFGIDQLFMEHYVTTQTSHPGRMAPNTALCFFLTGTTVVIVNLTERFSLVSLLGAVITGLGLIALSGYIAELETAYGWGHLTRMAVHTSVGFVLLGVGISLWGFSITVSNKEIRAYWTMAVVTVVLVVFVLALWQALGDWETRRAKDNVRDQLTSFKQAFELNFESRINSLERMEQRWTQQQERAQELWAPDAQQLVQDLKFFRAIQRVDSFFNVRWYVPLEHNQATLLLGSQPHEVLLQVRDSGRAIVMRTANSVRGEHKITIHLPLTINQEFEGVVSGILGVEELLPLLTQTPQFSENFVLRIYDGAQQIIGATATLDQEQDYFRVDTILSLRDEQWRAELIPRNNYLVGLQSSLPNLVLLSGLIAIAILQYSYFLRRREQTKTIQLQDEVNNRIRIEKSLAQSRSELRLILDSTQEGIYGLDRDGKIIFANPACCLLTGYPSQEILGLSHYEFMKSTSGDSNSPSQAEYFTAIYKGAVRKVDNEVFQRKDGSTFPVEFSGSPTKDEYGNITGAVVTFQDIGKRKQNENAIARYTHELERSNKELNDFAYVASHDLKAPLRGIMQLASWIEEDIEGSLEEQTKEYLDLMQNRVLRLEKLLDDLLLYSRVGRKHGNFRDIDVAAMVKDLFHLLEPPKGFELICDEGLPTLCTLSVPLEQIFRNLMNNAIKHHDSEKGVIKITAKENEGGYQFRVVDDGPGIPPEQHEKIFDIFQTLKPRDEVEGSGMGLAIVKKLLECYNSDITVESDGKRGTAIQFTWPTEMILRRIVGE